MRITYFSLNNQRYMLLSTSVRQDVSFEKQRPKRSPKCINEPSFSKQKVISSKLHKMNEIPSVLSYYILNERWKKFNEEPGNKSLYMFSSILFWPYFPEHDLSIRLGQIFWGFQIKLSFKWSILLFGVSISSGDSGKTSVYSMPILKSGYELILLSLLYLTRTRPTDTGHPNFNVPIRIFCISSISLSFTHSLTHYLTLIHHSLTHSQNGSLCRRKGQNGRNCQYLQFCKLSFRHYIWYYYLKLYKHGVIMHNCISDIISNAVQIMTVWPCSVWNLANRQGHSLVISKIQFCCNPQDHKKSSRLKPNIKPESQLMIYGFSWKLSLVNSAMD